MSAGAAWSGAQQRKDLLELIEQACTGGVRLARACAQMGLSERTVQRWQHPDGRGNHRRVSGLHERAEPPNKLSAFERQQAMALLNSEEFKNLPPSQIVPRLADRACYIASESTLARLVQQPVQRRFAGDVASLIGQAGNNLTGRQVFELLAVQ